MPPRLLARRDEPNSAHQNLPFTNDTITDDELAHGQHQNDYGASSVPRSHPIRASPSAAGILSSSFTQRNPIRSFAHQASSSTAEAPQYSSHGVRERTQELATYALDSEAYQGPRRRTSLLDPDFASARRATLTDNEGRSSLDSYDEDSLAVDDEPETPETVIGPERQWDRPGSGTFSQLPSSALPAIHADDDEHTPLLPKTRLSRGHSIPKHNGSAGDATVPSNLRGLGDRIGQTMAAGRGHLVQLRRSATNPNNYTKDAVMKGLLESLQLSSAVFLGLLLNILDALSYGYILFPLGSPIFSQTGPDGISIFFVSCIVAQLCYSLGLSVFRGGVGSEMIEVVPFFHKMAYSIMAKMEGQSPEAIIATTITSYCLSSVVTGLIFLSLGCFKLGNLVSFFPRHILIGCIGGVGFFLFVTGIEVSARLEGNLNYDMATLHKLFTKDTVALWMLPLTLAIVILVMRRYIKSPVVLPAFFIGVFAVFYIIVKGILRLDLEHVRNAGWIFEQPEAGVPFYRFYSYFKFGQIDGRALVSTIPTMFALSFFGIIHVPINVPALGAAVKEDNVNVNRELIAHGISNTISGCVGSIQNYLVYANSIMFIDNGGNSRLAGGLLAAATTGVWIAGPAMIGYIPICLVGALIFLLGIELMEEALVDTFGKCHRLEYLTILAIVLVMGVYDFVVGIFVGIVLACVSYVVQSSRVPAVRATYSGEVAESTVRRPRADRRYLNKVRGQIRLIKLSGFLFFGTIVSVEEYMRSLIDEDTFEKQPISFIIVDFSHVDDVDFSSSEGFQRINRILNRRDVKMIISGISFTNKVGQALQNVGLLDEERGDDACPPPQVFEDMNTALEGCENELLEIFYQHCNSPPHQRQATPPRSIKATPSGPGDDGISDPPPPSRLGVGALDPGFASPRRGARYLAAASTFREQGSHSESFGEADQDKSPVLPSKWKNFSQPLKIMLQTFEDVSTKNEDFWHVAASYFERKEYDAGTVLYSRGDEPNGFYILETGRFRAEYELEQGNFYEVILPGTTCGELPFFSETDRTGTVAVENDSVAWLLTRQKYKELEKRHGDVSAELLKVGLKLTKERMDAITSYVLVTAS